MTFKEHPKTKEEAIESIRAIMALPDDFILECLEEADKKYPRKKK